VLERCRADGVLDKQGCVKGHVISRLSIVVFCSKLDSTLNMLREVDIAKTLKPVGFDN
jgi:hypothetical protein